MALQQALLSIIGLFAYYLAYAASLLIYDCWQSQCSVCSEKPNTGYHVCFGLNLLSFKPKQVTFSELRFHLSQNWIDTGYYLSCTTHPAFFSNKLWNTGICPLSPHLFSWTRHSWVSRHLTRWKTLKIMLELKVKRVWVKLFTICSHFLTSAGLGGAGVGTTSKAARES